MSLNDPGIVCPAEIASLSCVICGKQLPNTDMNHTALMFDAAGQPKGWACETHVIALPLLIRREYKAVMCARCGLPMVGEHTVSTDGVFCRDGQEWIRAEPNKLAEAAD